MLCLLNLVLSWLIGLLLLLLLELLGEDLLLDLLLFLLLLLLSLLLGSLAILDLLGESEHIGERSVVRLKILQASVGLGENFLGLLRWSGSLGLNSAAIV